MSKQIMLIWKDWGNERWCMGPCVDEPIHYTVDTAQSAKDIAEKNGWSIRVILSTREISRRRPYRWRHRRVLINCEEQRYAARIFSTQQRHPMVTKRQANPDDVCRLKGVKAHGNKARRRALKMFAQ